MTPTEYLAKVLARESLSEESQELDALRKERDKVDELLVKGFPDSSPKIKYGGSKAKGTMIKSAYDLDIICYFARDDSNAGATLEDIYKNTSKALATDYMIQEKPTALRLRGKTGTSVANIDFHIDVVPGRYVDEQEEDVFLYQSSGDKKRLKTNLQVHLNHVINSGVRSTIRLMKLWRFRNGLRVKHFALELLTIKLLADKKTEDLPDQLLHVWGELKDNGANLTVEDPANPAGNDLSTLLDASTKSELSVLAGHTLSQIEALGWDAVFGAVDDDGSEGSGKDALKAAAAAVITPTKPWRVN